MKRMSKKLVISLAALSATALVGGGFGVVTNASANTSVTAETVSFTMAEGASARLKDDGHNGLRYAIEMNETQYGSLMEMVGEGKTYTEMTFGVLIAPATYETAYGDLNAANVFGIGGTAIYDWAVQNAAGEWEYTAADKTRIANFSTAGLTPSTAEGKEDVVTYYGSLTDILPANLTREFVGVGYMQYVENGATKVRFATENDNVRSIAYVASKAANSDEDYSEYNTVLKGYIAGALETGATDLELKGATEITALGEGENKQTLNLNTMAELDVQWTSSDDTVATVVGGELTWAKEGTVTVTASIGSLYECEQTLYSYVPEADNITYFNKAFGAKSVACAFATNSFEITNDKPSYSADMPQDGYVLKFNFTTNNWGTELIKFSNPYIANLMDHHTGSGFVAIDFWVYAAVTENAPNSFAPTARMECGNSMTSSISLSPNAWTKIRYYSYDGSNWFVLNATNGFADASGKNVSDLQLRLYYGSDGANYKENIPASTFYFTSLRVVTGV